MCVYLCVYMYMYLQMLMYRHVHIYMYIYICMYIYILFTYVYVYVYIYIYTLVCITYCARASWAISRYFDARKFRGNAGLKHWAIDVVGHRVHDVSFHAQFRFLAEVTSRVGKWVAWLESCPCHFDLLSECETHAQRKTAWIQAGVESGVTCVCVLRVCLHV